MMFATKKTSDVSLAHVSSASDSGTGSVVFNYTGARVNDLVVVVAGAPSSADGTFSSPTSGWTKLYDTYSVALFDANAAVFYKRLTDVESSMQVDYSVISSTVNAVAHVIRGSNALDPIGASAASAILGNMNQTPPDITCESDDSLILVGWYGNGASGFVESSPVAPSGYTNLVSIGDTAKRACLASALHEGGGTVSPGNWDAVDVADSDAAQILYTIEVKG